MNHKTGEHVLFLSTDQFPHDANFTGTVFFTYLWDTLETTGIQRHILYEIY